MKHLKTFEHSIDDTPEIGDYIILKIDTIRNPMTHEFINNNIGKIIATPYDNKYGGIKTIVEYEEKPPIHCMEYFNHDNHNNTYNCWFRLDMKDQKTILSYTFAPTKEELKSKINAKKYNL